METSSKFCIKCSNELGYTKSVSQSYKRCSRCLKLRWCHTVKFHVGIDTAKSEDIMKNKEYIGDSVYAEYDGFGLIITTENGGDCDPSNSIYLEPEILNSLNQFFQRVTAKLRKES